MNTCWVQVSVRCSKNSELGSLIFNGALDLRRLRLKSAATFVQFSARVLGIGAPGPGLGGKLGATYPAGPGLGQLGSNQGIYGYIVRQYGA